MGRAAHIVLAAVLSLSLLALSAFAEGQHNARTLQESKTEQHELIALRGDMFLVIDGKLKPGKAANTWKYQLWAKKGNLVRAEIVISGRKIVTIQRGSTIYTFSTSMAIS